MRLKGLRKEISACKNEPELKKLTKRYYQVRNKVDLLKLYQITRSNNKKYNKKIEHFFSLIRKDNVISIKNTFNEHSELNLIRYILKNDEILGYLEDENGKKIPYQYIGSSLTCCGSCSALIKGYGRVVGLNNFLDSDHIAIFVRAHNSYCYPRRFRVPDWSLKINQKTARGLRHLLLKLPCMLSLEKNRRFLEKTYDPSESDDQ